MKVVTRETRGKIPAHAWIDRGFDFVSETFFLGGGGFAAQTRKNLILCTWLGDLDLGLIKEDISFAKSDQQSIFAFTVLPQLPLAEQAYKS